MTSHGVAVLQKITISNSALLNFFLPSLLTEAESYFSVFDHPRLWSPRVPVTDTTGKFLPQGTKYGMAVAITEGRTSVF
ncbi:hypothetical protein AALO_G00222600 [Alosa alosa]|uniref:Uncharacterized protein n=1 Tax=Alosa alosa TaxID=278164 RepID=A0AAV6G1K6_9TELE|nr:hypothetical protein AALO_G00222600 [Alosa alosa]